ncbi:uncharacterized protein [Spinacia oleracea]|uniref:Integrase catalytic domain-containing protein n=1 Tax=Spinacia oleracea TaxID=3562 RepID=A0ABM3RI18_SPIOL|nr:uncharacterized protein LOC130469803 [Spinacia oleracea]
MKKDAINFAKKCDSCQRFASISHQPCEELRPILSPWPFMKWGMDIVGPLPQASGQRIFMLAMADYFSKWIEAEAFKRYLVCEAVSPPEVELPTARSSFMAPGMNDSVLSYDIDTVNELREAALVRMTSYQQAVANSYNKKVRARVFRQGDWVLRKEWWMLATS